MHLYVLLLRRAPDTNQQIRLVTDAVLYSNVVVNYIYVSPEIFHDIEECKVFDDMYKSKIAAFGYELLTIMQCEC